MFEPIAQLTHVDCYDPAWLEARDPGTRRRSCQGMIRDLHALLVFAILLFRSLRRVVPTSSLKRAIALVANPLLIILALVMILPSLGGVLHFVSGKWKDHNTGNDATW
jgi:hypothetical protein